MAFVIEFVNVMKGSRGIYAKWIWGILARTGGQVESVPIILGGSPCAKRNVPIAHCVNVGF